MIRYESYKNLDEINSKTFFDSITQIIKNDASLPDENESGSENDNDNDDCNNYPK